MIPVYVFTFEYITVNTNIDYLTVTFVRINIKNLNANVHETE